MTQRLVILFALTFPTVITWVYFVALADQSAALQQGAYMIGKVLQFTFPLYWVFVWQRRRPGWQRFEKQGLGVGVLFGAAVAVAMIGLYAAVLKPAGFFDGPGEHVRQKIAGMGLDTLWKYALLGVFYSLIHSLLEEYYWRWFVFGQLREIVRVSAAIWISSIGFAAHHVLVLAQFFGWQSPATWLFSAAVGIGGAIWAWIYQRSHSLLPPWIGHCLVDAAIFAIGYDLAFVR